MRFKAINIVFLSILCYQVNAKHINFTSSPNYNTTIENTSINNGYRSNFTKNQVENTTKLPFSTTKITNIKTSIFATLFFTYLIYFSFLIYKLTIDNTKNTHL